MSASDGIRAYIKPATIERYSKFVPVKIGQGVDEYLNAFMNNLESGKIAIQIQERRKR